MSDYAERIESIASKLRNLLEESEELKHLVEQRMMLEEDKDAACEDYENEEEEEEEDEDEEEEGDEEEKEEVPVIPELVTRRPWCFFCCRRY